MISILNSFNGKFGKFGGSYIPEILFYAVKELETNYNKYKNDPKFQNELEYYLTYYAGRPTPLYYAKHLSDFIGGCKIFLKREDLLHGGAHKLNNTLGQALLAKKMGKKRIIAETGAGQHGVATAMVCSLLGLKAEIYMGAEDVERQKSNVFRMKLLNAIVHPVNNGTKTLKDAINEALRDWVTNIENTHYLIGSVVGPHPYPIIVRDFQSVIGKEIKSQSLNINGKLPDAIVACVGGGSNSIGAFHDFINENTDLYGVEAGGKGIKTNEHAASLVKGKIGVLHGSKTYILQDIYGQIQSTHSVSAGLDYPGVGPELSYLKEKKLAKFVSISDNDAVKAFKLLSKYEGIIPALEYSHALSYAINLSKRLDKNSIIVVNLSGRGDKDIDIVANYLGENI